MAYLWVLIILTFNSFPSISIFLTISLYKKLNLIKWILKIRTLKWFKRQLFSTEQDNSELLSSTSLPYWHFCTLRVKLCTSLKRCLGNMAALPPASRRHSFLVRCFLFFFFTTSPKLNLGAQIKCHFAICAVENIYSTEESRSRRRSGASTWSNFWKWKVPQFWTRFPSWFLSTVLQLQTLRTCFLLFIVWRNLHASPKNFHDLTVFFACFPAETVSTSSHEASFLFLAEQLLPANSWGKSYS